MDNFAHDALTLNKRLRAGMPQTEAERTEIVRLLQQIEEEVSHLEAPGHRSNHPLIDANLQGFKLDVERARTTAEQNPPNYFLAGSIVGSCVYCHGNKE